MAMNVTKRGKNGQNSCEQKKVPTPPPVPEPRKMRKLKSQDMRAFLLYGQGMTQRQIADELGCDQATVSRALARYRLWQGKSLPEDRGPLTAEDDFKVDIERHRIFLEHAQSLAMTEYHRSCQTLAISKTREKVYPEGRKTAGSEVKETQTDKYDKVQYGHVASLNAAVRYSHERLVLAAGHIGPGNGCMSLAAVMDPDERERWDRAVKNQKAHVKALTAELAAARAVPIASPEESASNCIKSSSEMHQHKPAANAVNPAVEIVCGELVEPAQPPIPLLNEIPQVHKKSTPHARREEVISRSEMSTILEPEPSPTYRWSAAERQEALDLHYVIHRLPPAKLAQASGIPDPVGMTPKEAVQRGRPYIISIDHSAEIQRAWERRERERREERPESEW